MIAEGVTCVEVKSGYGLDTDTELRMLRVARAIYKLRPIRVKTSFLGAHATPADHTGHDDAHIHVVCIPTLRAAHAEGLVDAVDGFCEGIAFRPAQIAHVFDVARALGLPVKLHAAQFSNLGGANWLQAMVRFLPIISSISTKIASKPWPLQGLSSSFYPVRFIRYAKPKRRQLTCCTNIGFR